MITTQAAACGAAAGVAAALTCHTGVDMLTLTCAGTGAWFSASVIRDMPMWRWLFQFAAAAWLSAVFGTFAAHAGGLASTPGAAGTMAGVIALFFHKAVDAGTEAIRPMFAELWGAVVARIRGSAPPGGTK